MTDPTHGPGGDLRTLLEDAVSDVEPRLGLEEIQARTARPRRRPWTRGVLTAGVAVAATAATVAAVTVVTDRSPQQRADTPPAASSGPDATSSASDDPTTAATEDPTAEPSQEATPAPSTSSAALPVYYVGSTPAGPRLFREFATPAGAGDDASRMLQALRDAVMGTPADPDYVSPWPRGWSVERTGLNEVGGRQVIEVAVQRGPGAPSWSPDGAASDGRLALQQLVYTAQGVLQQRLPVQFVGEDGLPLRTLLDVDVSQPMGNDPEMKVLAPVWVIDPAQDGIVGSTFTVQGIGTFFEGTVSWQLLEGDRVVQKGFTTAPDGMSRSPFEFALKGVDPGTYTLRVYDADMSGGEGGGEQQDTKEIVVR